MDTYGYLWIPMDTYGYLWIPMDTYGYLWLPMVTYGYLWLPMVALLPYPHITTSWPAPGNFLLAGTIEGSYPPATMDGSTGWGFDDAFLVELEASPSGAPKIRCEN